MTWREKLRPRILQVIEENRGKTVKEIRMALREAYPFSRKYGPKHQYKIWCDEVNKQLGLRIPKGKSPKRDQQEVITDPNQPDLF